MNVFQDGALELVRMLNKDKDGNFGIPPDELVAICRGILTPYDSEEVTNPNGVALARAFRAADKSRP